jgi:hypothetical protein
MGEARMSQARQAHYAMVGVIVLGYVFLSWVVLPTAPAGFAWDDTWYLFMAEWFSGRQEHLPLVFEMMRLRQYPPLLPFLVSMTGDVLTDFSLAMRMNVAFLALSSALVLRWLAKECLPWPVALVGALVVMLNPVALGFISILLSEPLFLLLTTLALMLAVSTGGSSRRWVALGLLAGLAIATRSAGWALAIALLGQCLLDRRYHATLAYLAGLALGLLFLAYLKAGLPDAHTYTQGFLENLADINGDYLAGHLVGIYAGWVSLWGGAFGAVAVLALVVPGLVMRLRDRRADAFYIVVSLAMLMAWPFPGQMGRFLWVLLPALLVSAGTTMRWAGSARVRAVVPGTVLFFAFALTVPNGIARITWQLLAPLDQDLQQLSRMSDWSMASDRETGMMTLRVSQMLLDDIGRIATETTVRECVYSEYPALVAFHANRVSSASPWNRVEDVGSFRLKCAYYYLVPDALPSVSNEAVAELASRNEEIFRSLAPYDPEGRRVLGVFLKLDSVSP